MRKVYLDNAATSFPKAPGVSDAVKHYMDYIGASINRSTYEDAIDAGMTTLSLRERVCRIFHAPDIHHVIITSGATAGLNMLIKGYFKKGDHILVSSLEHNAVMRPLNTIAKEISLHSSEKTDFESLLPDKDISYTRIPYSPEKGTDFDALSSLLQKNTKALIMLHASNVSGNVHDLDKAAGICKKYNLKLILDAAQTAGHYPIDFKKHNIAAMAIPGHKALMGPQGIGLLILRPDFAKKLTPLLEGGTGSASDSECTPDFMPDKFEAGTPNIPAIYGLEKALEFLEKTGIEEIQKHDELLIHRFITALSDFEGVRILGEKGGKHIGVVSLDFTDHDNALIGAKLENEFGILTRCGLHCAPCAHKVYSTNTRGSVRFSFGFFNTKEDVDFTLDAIKKILKKGM